MEIDLFTTGVLIPAIPLLMVNFGNRYSSMSALIRRLHANVMAARERDEQQASDHIERHIKEIGILRQRLRLNRITQVAIGVAFLADVLAMCLIVLGALPAATAVFLVALLLIASSMVSYLVEIALSSGALNLHLADLEQG